MIKGLETPKNRKIVSVIIIFFQQTSTLIDMYVVIYFIKLRKIFVKLSLKGSLLGV